MISVARSSSLKSRVRSRIAWAVVATAVSLALMVATAPAQAQAQAQAQANTVALQEPDTTGGPVIMRRLTEAQYRATVADVFGPDIPVVGRFERALRSDGLIAVGTSEAGLSAFSLEQYDASARGIAAVVVSPERRGELVPCVPESNAAFDAACAGEFVEHYGSRLFRRPLTESEVAVRVDAARGAAERLGDFYRGLEFTLVGMLVAPDFLLRIERSEADPSVPAGERLDAFSRATRLSYFLTGSTPDRELLDAAAAGELDSPEGLALQVDRLMADPRYEDALREFFADMLRFDMFDDTAKDPLIYPAFNSTVAADAQEQTLRTITDHLLGEQGDYRTLFTTRAAPMTRALGIVYRQPVVTRSGWQSGEFTERSGRAGIQSHVSFLALHSHPGRSSPTLRGKAIREVFLCQHIPDPPVDVDFTGINDDANSARPTARDRLEAHRTETPCKACHILMDPAGLALERYDGLGSFRTRENGAVIDVAGALDRREFEAADGLGQALHDHRETPVCLVRRMYQSAAGRVAVRGERDYLAYLNELFAASGYRVPQLMRAIATGDALYRIEPVGSEEAGAVAHVTGETGESS